MCQFSVYPQHFRRFVCTIWSLSCCPSTPPPYPPPHRIRLVEGVPVPGVLDGWMMVEFCLRLLVGMLWSFLKLKPSKPCICRKTQDLEQG